MRIIDAKKLEKTLVDRVSADMEMGRLAGAAMMVAQHGEVVCDLHIGSSNVDTGAKLEPHAMFRLASMTKPVAGVACLIGIQNGWFGIDDLVSDYLPGFDDMYVGRLENGKAVPDHKVRNKLRIFHLLSHCSGFVAEDELGHPIYEAIPYRYFSDNRTMVEHCVKNTLLSFEPGEASAYSAYVAFDALACIIQDKSGMSYADFLDKNLFRPLGITDLTFRPTEEQWGRMVAMHDKMDSPRMLTVNMGRYTFEGFPLDYTCAGASITGSIEDYRIFAELLRGRGEFNGVRIFEDKLADLLSHPYVADGTPGRDPENSWGLGVRVAVHNSVIPNGSFGWSGAYGTHFWVDPENDLVALYMKNNRWYDSHGCGSTGATFERDVMSALR